MRLTMMTAVLLASTAAFAAPPGGQVPVEELTETLALDENQAAQVEQILNAQHERMEGLRELERSDRRAEKELIRNDTRTQLQSVLNEEQLEKFDELHQQRKGRRGKDRGSRNRTT